MKGHAAGPAHAGHGTLDLILNLIGIDQAGEAAVFAVVIALIGCYQGLKVSQSAESVGRLTTVSVVESIFLVIVLDAAFSIVFSYLHV